jgi:hypothetical protein
MGSNVISRRVRVFTLVGLGGFTLAGTLTCGTVAAEARPVPPLPTVQLGSVAGLAPDGRSVDIGLTASCPPRWTVVEAKVSVAQPRRPGKRLSR